MHPADVQYIQDPVNRVDVIAEGGAPSGFGWWERTAVRLVIEPAPERPGHRALTTRPVPPLPENVSAQD